MSSIDWEALKKVDQALIVISIILAILINFLLLYKVVRAAGGLSSLLKSPRGPRFQTLVSLTLGDILVALSSFVVLARLLFEGEANISCRTMVLSHDYQVFIMPFVYGMGLAVLLTEWVIFRRRLRKAPASRMGQGAMVIWSVGMTALPWVWGIVFVLPLSIADVDMSGDLNNCPLFSDLMTVTRKKVLICVCLFFPSCVALIIGCLILLSGTKLCVCNARITNPGEVIAMQEQTATMLTTPSAPTQTSAPYSTSCEPPLSHEEAGADLLTLQPRLDMYYSEKEKRSLFIASLAFCVCVIPFAVLGFAHTYDTVPEDLKLIELVIFGELTFWLFSARTFVLPFTWIISGSLISSNLHSTENR
ncbi:hypothetical protein PoB_001017700 [Plakobranchus ocellatus]|uniref:G-protein coupled receptors family 1 profile domain-containing protein n=1 Tax=Plakobranchus ocellatus TaxID=259542 RepID=A0AAV3YL80_9GAST|nr:hypothetical protein PoB_001017700 [Plakobranchus ocellatus]